MSSSEKRRQLARSRGKALKVLRLGRRLTQRQVVLLSEGRINQGQLSKIENGECLAKDPTIQVLLDILRCTPEQFGTIEESLYQSGIESESREDLFNLLSHDSFCHDPSKVNALQEVVLDKDVASDIASLNVGLVGMRLSPSLRCSAKRLQERVHSLSEDQVRLMMWAMLESVVRADTLVADG